MRRLLLAFLALLLCLACFGERKSTAPAAQADDGRPRDGGTLIRRLEADIATLNPVIATSIYDRLVDQYLFTPLVHFDQDLEVIPGIASSWDVSPDGTVYRFELNDKATFSDGTPVKASDVLFTLRKIADPASEAVQVAGAFAHLDLARTRVLDDHTIEVVFRQPLASQLIRFNDVVIVPEHVYSKGDFKKDFHSRAVGSGPYKLVRRVPGKEIVLARREDYWDHKPPIENVIFKVIVDHGTAWNALKRGDVDETRLASDTWLRERNNPSLNDQIDFRRFYTLGYNFLAWNNRNPLLTDGRVRRALAMCIPTDTVIQELYHNTARAMNGPFTPDDMMYNPNVPVIRYDPAGARQLLALAGWTDSNGDGMLDRGGKPFQLELLIMSGSSVTTQFAQMLQAEMKQIGLGLELAMLEPAMAITRILAGNYEAAYLSFDLDPDPDPFAILHSSQFPPRGQNFVYYANPEVDRLIVGARTEMNRSRRKDLYWRLHEIVAEEQPYTWTLQVSSKWGLNRRVRGAEISRGYGLYRWYPGELGWWIADPPAGVEGTATAAGS